MSERNWIWLSVTVAMATGAAWNRDRFWGDAGHRLTAQASIASLPSDMPEFFRAAGPQLTYLNPEPDRWRNRLESQRDAALDGASAPDHFLDYELIPAASRASALLAKDRYAFADTLRAHGVDPATAGMLPYAILELTQRIRIGFRQWRVTTNAQTRAWIEARILNDAGVLGHYVADASNPAHTTIHYNGWVGANPQGYATDNRFHSRFESAYVERNIRLSDVQPNVVVQPQVLTDLRPAIIAYFLQSHAQVERLYALDKLSPFGPETTGQEHKAFTAVRLAAGATMLRDLWWTAWVMSASNDDVRPGRK